MTTHNTEVDRLVVEHRSYAHALASDILKKLPPHVERVELQSAAELGLVEAATVFDARLGVQFKTFAYYRIRGAIYDAIRKAKFMQPLNDEKAESTADPSESAEERLIHKELGVRLGLALARLPAQNRRVIEGCYYQNRTLEDVGAELGLSKSWTCRAAARRTLPL